MSRDMITQQFLKELFDYHPDGYFINKITRGRSAKAGNRTCKENVKQYRQVLLFGYPYREHVLIWIWHYGQWPDVIDHIDRDPLNNKIENLRSVSHRENIRHGWVDKQRGVSPWKNGKWIARIYSMNKNIHLGIFNTYEEAVAKRKWAEQEVWT